MPHIDTGRISLFYTEHGTGGVPVLLLHELGGSSESWEQVIPHLAASRRTIAVDFRNAGRSEKPIGTGTLTDYAEDIHSLLTALDIHQTDIVGSALGAIVSIQLALLHPGQLRRMVICAVTDEITPETRQYLIVRAEHVRQVGMRAVAAQSLANSFPDTHRQARERYLPIFLANHPEAYANTSVALAQTALDPQSFERIALPVLVLSGDGDFIWPPAFGQRVAARMPSSTFQTMPDTGHFPHLQSPAELGRICSAFLDQ